MSHKALNNEIQGAQGEYDESEGIVSVLGFQVARLEQVLLTGNINSTVEEVVERQQTMLDVSDTSNSSYCVTNHLGVDGILGSTNSQLNVSVTDTSNQKNMITELILNNPNKPIPKRGIEKIFTSHFSMKELSDEDIKNIKSKNELIEKMGFIPGDVQRQVRSVVADLKKKGYHITKTDKDIYLYEPEKNAFAVPLNDQRHIFNDPNEKKAFIESHDGRCEFCGSKHSFENPHNIDHWRPYNRYHNSNQSNAVLLCEGCNQMHHDHDGSVLIKKLDAKHDSRKIENWIRIETRIRELGLYPNGDDIEYQERIVKKLYNELNEIGINIFDFYPDLDKLFYLDDENNIKYLI